MSKAGDLDLRYECLMVTVDGRPWIQGADVMARLETAVERGVAAKGGRLDAVDMGVDYLRFTFATAAAEKPTAYMLAVRDAITDMFGDEPPETMGRAQQSRGYFSRWDFALATVGDGVPEGIADELADCASRRFAERERKKRVRKQERGSASRS